jgi:hypothetical protein
MIRGKVVLVPYRMLTISVSLILRELGEISPRMQAEIDSRLRRLFRL